jgi:hypothetical protein
MSMSFSATPGNSSAMRYCDPFTAASDAGANQSATRADIDLRGSIRDGMRPDLWDDSTMAISFV